MTTFEEHYICDVCLQRFNLKELAAYSNEKYFCINCHKHAVKEIFNNKQMEKYKEIKTNFVKCDKFNDDQIGDIFEKPKLTTPTNVKREFAKREEKSVKVVQSTSTMSLSKKPIICPYKNCKKAIAITQIENHFKHEHKKVAQIKTRFDARNGLFVHLNDINYNETLCLVLINVINSNKMDDNDDCINSITKQITSSSLIIQPTIVALITKLPTSEEYLDGDDEYDNVSDYSDSFSTSTDRIFVWIASNIPTRYYYTLVASTLCNTLRLKYYGRMMALTENYERLCENGQGLILSQNHIIGMTENGQKPITLDILIHDHHDDD